MFNCAAVGGMPVCVDVSLLPPVSHSQTLLGKTSACEEAASGLSRTRSHSTLQVLLLSLIRMPEMLQLPPGVASCGAGAAFGRAHATLCWAGCPPYS